MELLDVVFRNGEVFPDAEDQVHGVGVSGHFLLVAGREGLDLQIGEEPLDVRSESLLPSMRVDEPMLSIVATRRSADSALGRDAFLRPARRP